MIARVTRPKITREEPEGPLRTGLKDISQSAGHAYGGRIFAEARNLANAGLEVALSLHHGHGLGDPDRSIPATYHSVAELRKRGVYVDQGAYVDSAIEEMYEERDYPVGSVGRL